jgi:hypothetical protein
MEAVLKMWLDSCRMVVLYDKYPAEPRALESAERAQVMVFPSAIHPIQRVSFQAAGFALFRLLAETEVISSQKL